MDWIRIENSFGKIKEFKLIALHAGKTDRSFAIEREAHVRAPIVERTPTCVAAVERMPECFE